MADDFDPYYTWLGIPPKDQPPNHYRLLGVELCEGNLDVIENAADRQMAHVRLFQNGPQGDRSQKLLNEITSAKLCLLNAGKKADYDQQLRAAQQAAEAAARPQARAVRATPKAQPMAPADPAMPFDEALDVVSLGRDPVVLPVFSSTAFSTPAGETAPASAERDGRKKVLLLLAAAGVAVVSVAALLMLTLRGTDKTDVAGAGAGSGTTSVDPLPVKAGKKSSIDDPATPRTGKTPPAQSKTTTNPATTTKGPPTVRPPAADPSGLSLRFVGRDYAEVLDTAANVGPSDWPLTAEMWVRLNPTKERTYLMGNIAHAGTHPKAPPGIPSGWALSYAHRAGPSGGPEQRGLLLEVGSQLHPAAKSEMDDAWHHVALCRAQTRPDVTYQVFLDGQLVLTASVPLATQRFSPAELALGCPPWQPVSNFIQTDMACRAFRLSSMPRYREAFTPPASFESDSQTRTLLDFAQARGNAIVDRPTSGHPGRIFGAEWMSSAGLLTASGGLTNLFFAFDLDHDATGGKWSLARPAGLPPDQLEVSSPSGPTLLRLPFDVPREYDLEAMVRRREGKDLLAIGFTCGDSRVALVCDNESGKNTLLDTVTGGGPVRAGPLLEIDRSVTLLIQVRSGRIEVLADGKSILSWRGNEADLKMPEVAASPIGKGLFLATRDSSFRFDKLELRDVAPRGTPRPFTYLDDLTEADSSVGFGKLGKHGDRGYSEGVPNAIFRGRNYTHALSLHPPRSGKAHVSYRLDGRYSEFHATAALLERTDWQKAGSPLTFRVFGDGKQLWESSPLQTHGTGQECATPVSGVSVLKLEIECPGVNHGAHTAWLLPTLIWANSSQVPIKSPKTTPKTTPKTAPPIAKAAPPDDAALATLLESVRKTFAKDYAKTKTAEDRLKLADKLYQESSQGGLDAPSRYALLYESRQLAADAGSLPQAGRAIEGILERFDAPPGPLWSDALSRAVKSAKTNDARREVALACLGQGPLVFRQGHYEAAEGILQQAANLLAQRDNQLARRARELAKQATGAKDRLAQADAAKQTLATASDDGKAHLTLGKYLCFVRDDWTTGMVHLAKAGDDALAKLAQREQAAGADAKEQEALAEAWAAWSKAAAAGFDREAAWERAAHWYVKALPAAEGAAKTRVSQRLEELADKLAAESLVARTPWLDIDPQAPRRWAAHKGISGLAASRDGTLLATTNYSEPSKLWHVASGRLLREFPASRSGFVALSPDGRLLASGPMTPGPTDTSIPVWDTQTGKLVRSFGYTGTLRHVTFSDDGQWLAIASQPYVEICETKTGRSVKRFDSMIGYSVFVGISPDRRLLIIHELGIGATAGRQLLRLIDLATGKPLPTLNASCDYTHAVAFAPDGRTAALACGNGAYLWSLADGKLIQQLSTRVQDSVSYSGDGSRLLLAGLGPPEVRRADGTLLHQLPGSSLCRKAVLTHDGRAVIGGDAAKGEVLIWRVPD